MNVASARRDRCAMLGAMAPDPSFPRRSRRLVPATVLLGACLPALLAACASAPRADAALSRIGLPPPATASDGDALFRRIGAEPTNARLHYDNGRFLLERGRHADLEVARVAFANAARLARDWWQPQLARAATEYRLGRYRDALAAYADAVALRGSCAQLCYGLALAAWRAGEFGLAANALEEARRLGPPADDGAATAERFVAAGLAQDDPAARPATPLRARLQTPRDAEAADGKNVSIDAYVIRQSRDSSSQAGINLLGALELQFGGTLVNTYDREGADATHGTERSVEVTIPSVSYALNMASASRGAFSIEASPSVVAVPGQTSRFFEGASVLIVPAGDETEPLERDVGVDLKVTPGEIGEDFVELTAVLELSNLTTNTIGGANATVVQTEKTSAEATARIPFGRAIALGSGATMTVRDGDSGTPGLSRLPVASWLFGSRQASARRSDVLVLITARKGDGDRAAAVDPDAISTQLFGRAPAEVARVSRLPSQAPTIDVEAWL